VTLDIGNNLALLLTFATVMAFFAFYLRGRG
jgi:hypothetical protein